MFLYDIPSLQPISTAEDKDPIRVQVRPVAVYTDTRSTPTHHNSKPIWKCLCDHHHHSGQISLMTGDWDQVNDFIVTLPPVGLETTSESESAELEEFTRTEIKLPGAAGYSQVIWMKTDSSAENDIELFTGAFSPRPSSHIGHTRMRMGTRNLNNPDIHSTIVLGGCYGQVEDISYSEEDGRICLVCWPLMIGLDDRVPSHRRSVVIVDLV